MKNNYVRSENKINLLRLLYKQNMSRVDLARALGLSKSLVTGLIAELESQNLIAEVGLGESGETGGKKPMILSVNRDAGMILSIHFDNALCGISIADMTGEIKDSATFEIDIDDDAMKALKDIAAKTHSFIESSPAGPGKAVKAGKANKEHPFICGVSVKGLVDSDSGVLAYTSMNRSWKDVPIGDFFSRALGVSTFVDNDARALMCLDAFASPAAEHDVACCICIEKGIGTAAMIGNNILTGAFFGAVNFAHTTIDPGGPACMCGKKGCWESHASTDALVRKARAAIGRPDENEIAYSDIVGLYRSGDRNIAEVLMDDYCRWIGIGIANYSQIFNPRRIVIYVDEGLFDDALKERVLETVRAYGNEVTAKSGIAFSPNGPALHLRAAAALAVKRFLSTEFHDILMKGAA